MHSPQWLFSMVQLSVLGNESSKKNVVEFDINLFNKLSVKEMEAIEKAKEEYKLFVSST